MKIIDSRVNIPQQLLIAPFNKRVDKVSTDLRSGQKYDAKLVEIALSHPFSEAIKLLQQETSELFENTLKADGRISTQLPISSQIYRGSWYFQGNELTCCPWSVANAFQALGIKPNPYFIAELLNFANNIDDSREKVGMNYHDVKRIADLKYQDSPIKLVGLKRKERLKLSIDKPFIVNIEIQDKHRKNLVFFGLPSLTQEEHKELQTNKKIEDIITNAKIIKQILDNGGKILIGVTTKEYSNDKTNRLHAICIAGYRINESGHMDVQIIDSYIGIHWISLEHLSACLSISNSYKIEKKN